MWAGGVAQKQACIHVEVLGFSSEQAGKNKRKERKERKSELAFEKRKQDSKLVLMTQNYEWERRHCN